MWEKYRQESKQTICIIGVLILAAKLCKADGHFSIQEEEEIEKSPENQELQQKLEELQKEKDKIEKKLEEQNKKIVDGKIIKYNQTTHQFEHSEPIDGFEIVARRRYPTTTDLLEQTGNYEESCYIEKEGTKFEYDESSIHQSSALGTMNLTLDQARSYEKYCKRTK